MAQLKKRQAPAKRVAVVDEVTDVLQQIHALEASVLESRTHANNIVSLLSLCQVHLNINALHNAPRIRNQTDLLDCLPQHEI